MEVASMQIKFLCVVAVVLLPVVVAGSGGVRAHDRETKLRKLSERKASANATETKPADYVGGGGLVTTPPSPYITTPGVTPTTPMTPTTPVTTPTTPMTPTTPGVTPTTPMTPTTPVTTPTTPVTTPTTPVSGQSWCVARTNIADKNLQVALDYACGLGGADCRPIQKGGACYEPETVAAHASYAFNSYYQKNNLAPGTCDFGGNAIITTTNPSYSSCIYSTATSTGTPTTPVTTPTTPVTTPTTPMTPTIPMTPTTPTTPTTPVYNTSPPGGITTPIGGGITTPTGGITGGIPTSFGPTSSFNSTYSGAPSAFQYLCSSLTFLVSLSTALVVA